MDMNEKVMQEELFDRTLEEEKKEKRSLGLSCKWGITCGEFSGNAKPLNASRLQLNYLESLNNEIHHPLHNPKMAESTDAELKELFSSACPEMEADVLTELNSIMRLHSIDAQELWYKWESYSIKMGSDDMKLNIETARALKKDVQDGLERENRTKSHVLNSNKRGGATPRNVTSNGDVFGMYGMRQISNPFGSNI